MSDTKTAGINMDAGSVVLKLKDAPDDAPEGFRLSRHVAKKSKEGTYSAMGDTSLAVFVPVRIFSAPFASEFPALNAAFGDAIEKWEDDTIRAKLEAGAKVIYSADITLARINEYLASTPEGLGKLSADKIKAWFAADLAENLSRVLREKLGEQASEEKITQALNNYRDIFARLAEKKPSFEPKVLENLNKAIVLANDSPMSEKVAEKLSKAATASADLMAL